MRGLVGVRLGLEDSDFKCPFSPEDHWVILGPITNFQKLCATLTNTQKTLARVKGVEQTTYIGSLKKTDI